MSCCQLYSCTPTPVYKSSSITSNGTNAIITTNPVIPATDKSPFKLILCHTPTNTGLPVLINVNGNNVALVDRYGEAVADTALKSRCVYIASYVASTKEVVLLNSPKICIS